MATEETLPWLTFDRQVIGSEQEGIERCDDAASPLAILFFISHCLIAESLLYVH